MAINTSKGTLDDPVLQIVRTSSDSFQSGSTNNWNTNPMGTLSITPKNSGSLIVIMYTACISGNMSANDCAIRLLRNGSVIQNANNGRNLMGAMQSSFIASGFAGSNCTCTFWDNPNTTGSVGYAVQHRPQTGGGGTMYFNGTAATGGGDSWGSRSFLTIVEYAQN